MKNKIFFILFFFLFLHSKCQFITTYQYESLLYKYIETYLEDSIEEDTYMLFTYRTLGVCKDCYRISMDSLLVKVYNEKEYYPLYVLFDEESELEKVKLIYANKINYLLSIHLLLDKYGFSKTVPTLFIIQKNKLVNHIRFNRK